MKLNEIKTLESSIVDLTEGVIPIHITMTLEQVVNAGQITNSVQTFIMSNLANMFKDGGPYRWARELNSYGAEATTEIVEAIRSLSGDQQKELAEWFLIALQTPAEFESRPDCGMMTSVDWVQSVLKHQ